MLALRSLVITVPTHTTAPPRGTLVEVTEGGGGLPPSSPPASALPSTTVAQRLNWRFHSGGPASSLEDSGILIHQACGTVPTTANSPMATASRPPDCQVLSLPNGRHVPAARPSRARRATVTWPPRRQFDSLDDRNPDGEPWRPRRPAISAALVNDKLQPEPDRGTVPLYSRSLAVPRAASARGLRARPPRANAARDRCISPAPAGCRPGQRVQPRPVRLLL